MQKYFEFSTFEHFLGKHQINLTHASILDVGCGSGYSTRLLKAKFNPTDLIAFDFMPEQIELARKKDSGTNYFVGDVTHINLPAGTFDAVYEFAILHHVPEWRKALREIFRVLKPNGVFLAEDIDRKGVDWADKIHCYHPQESRFEWQHFIEELRDTGFKIVDSKILFQGMRSFLCVKPGNSLPSRNGETNAGTGVESYFTSQSEK